MCAGLIDRDICSAVSGLHQAVGQEKCFHLGAAYVRQHSAIDLHAGAQGLAALFDHLPPLGRVVDDVAVLERQFVFPQHSPDPLAPAASRLQVSDNLWFFHISVILTKLARSNDGFKSGLILAGQIGWLEVPPLAHKRPTLD
jgi:hypothetical protein